jgi:ribosomal protein L11 methyltransferase
VTLASDTPTLELIVDAGEELQDHLIAQLGRFGFEAFLQDAGQLRAYRSLTGWSAETRTGVERLLNSLCASCRLEFNEVAPENWNRNWERSIQPVVVGPFIVTPSWQRSKDQEEDLIPLEIDPKMSFGTGYHATTRLMLRMLPSIVRPGQYVLDAGTGTGILAIASAHLGAARVFAFDIDPWSERNARENCARNGVADVVVIRQGDIDCVPRDVFGSILANIQLDVIVSMLQELVDRLAPAGSLLVSGILKSQEEAFRTAAGGAGLAVTDALTEEEWWAATLVHEGAAG